MTNQKTKEAVSPRDISDVVGRPGLLDYIPEGWHTRGQAATMLRRHPDTLKKWEKRGIYSPSGYMDRGLLRINLYSDIDIENMREVVATLHVGRPPKEASET